MAICISIFLAIFLLVCRRVQGTILAPAPLFILGWLIPYAVLSANIIDYSIEIDWTTHLVMVLFVCSFVAGSIAATPKDVRKVRLADIPRLEFSRVAWSIILALAAIELGLDLVDMISAQGRSVLALDPSAIRSTRNLAWAAYFDGNVESNALRAIPTAAQQIVAMATPYFFVQRRRMLFVFGLASIMMTGFASLFVGGRFNVVFVILAVYFGLLIVSSQAMTPLQKRVISFVKWSPIIFTIPALLLLFLYFPILRNPFILEHPDKFLIGAGVFSDWLRDLVTTWKLPELYILAISSTYFSYTLIACQVSLQFGHVQEWYGLGLYDFGFISQVMGALGLGNPFLDYRIQIAWFMNSLGLPRNPWATGARDFIIDFGYVGAVLAIFPVGYIVTHFFFKLARSNKIEAHVARSLILMMSSIFGILSPFPQKIVSSCLLLLILLFTIDRVFKTLGWWPYSPRVTPLIASS